MAETQILGVDFSGGGDDDHVGNTWFSKGRLDGNMLTIDDCKSISRRDLEKKLEKLPLGSVAAMDFPFGVPEGFLDFQNCQALAMPKVWEAFASTSPEKFWCVARKLAKRRRKQGHKRVELKREGDEKHFPEALSTLNIRMYRMTLRGMQMLHRLYSRNPARWSVPPLTTSNDSTICLLELMPGAFLNGVGFPRTVTKRYKNAKNYLHNRKLIIERLADRVKPLDIRINLSDRDRHECLKNDNCLDSVVAAVAAAAWKRRPDYFRHPQDSEKAAARLEGWIYAPRPIS